MKEQPDGKMQQLKNTFQFWAPWVTDVWKSPGNLFLRKDTNCVYFVALLCNFGKIVSGLKIKSRTDQNRNKYI